MEARSIVESCKKKKNNRIEIENGNDYVPQINFRRRRDASQKMVRHQEIQYEIQHGIESCIKKVHNICLF